MLIQAVKTNVHNTEFVQHKEEKKWINIVIP